MPRFRVIREFGVSNDGTHYRHQTMEISAPNPDKAVELLGWNPVDVNEIVELTDPQPLAELTALDGGGIERVRDALHEAHGMALADPTNTAWRNETDGLAPYVLAAIRAASSLHHKPGFIRYPPSDDEVLDAALAALRGRAE